MGALADVERAGRTTLPTKVVEAEIKSYKSFHGLKALRGIAAIVVLKRHAPSFFGLALFHSSGLGVDLFCVMIGFVIAYAYSELIRDGLSVANFMRVRLIRLYPLYILGTLIGIVAAAASLATGVQSTRGGIARTPVVFTESGGWSLFPLPAPLSTAAKARSIR